MVSRDWKSLPTVVFAIALVALVAGITGIILGEFQTEQETTTAVVNESINCTTLGSAVTLDVNAATSFFVTLVNSSITSVQNDTNSTGPYLRAGNFTIGTTAGTITCTSGGALATNTLYNLSYSYTIGSTARNIYGEGITGILEITSWLDIIALIFAVGILLYLVVRVIGGHVQERYGGQGY